MEYSQLRFIFVLLIGLFGLSSANSFSRAAEKINIKFEEMSIPLTIDNLSKLETFKNESNELSIWFRKIGFLKVLEFSKYLEYPIFKEEGLNRQVLRSWLGRKILTELSDTIIVPGDNDGIGLFNTIENLVESQNKVSTLDLLKAIPSEEIILDLDNLIKIISSWKKELEMQQNLVLKLNASKKIKRKLLEVKANYDNEDLIKTTKKLYPSHRVNPLKIELWKTKNSSSQKELIIFMPGLGGDIKNFSWIGEELSKRGWPIIFIDHKGTNAKAFVEVLEGKESIPGSADFFLYRIKDLETVVKAHMNNSFELNNDSYILMGHSLGALIAFLYEGNLPKEGLGERCDIALKDFALTNLSRFLQCQLNEISLPEKNKFDKAKAIVGFNSFGSLIWPNERSSGINSPVLLIGGTFDLITPLISEQFKLFLSTASNPLNRFLIIEGASHFSPIRINHNDSKENKSNDIFKISSPYIGLNPKSIQNLSLKVVIEFLNNLERGEGIQRIQNQREKILDFHILDKKSLKEIINN